MKIEEVHIGQRVKWNDPDGDICSGPGTVIRLGEDGIINLRNDDGGELEVLAHEIDPIEELKQLFTVSMRVDGRVNVSVEASSFEEAFEMAKREEYDPTQVECIECTPVNATDSNGILKDYE